jgi:hypothetical protein
MSFPDWVEKYRTKGKAINHVNGKYYLYEVHSERVKGTSIVKKINDKYLGRITEDGLIPPKSKVKGDIIIKEYGIYAALISINKTTLKGIIRDYPNDYKIIIISSLIQAVYSELNITLYNNSYMSILYKDIDPISLNENINFTIHRLTLMIKSNLSKMDIDINKWIHVFRNVNMVLINNEWHLSTPNSDALKLINKYKINMEDLLCLE